MAYPMACGVVATLIFLFTTTLAAMGNLSPANPLSVALPFVALVTMPGAFLLGLLRERLSYGSVAEFVRTIEGTPVGRLQAALRKVLKGVHSRGAVNWCQLTAGSGGSQAFPPVASRMASSAVIPWAAAESR
jgi:hypothetical protein